MATMNVSLPDALKAHVEKQVESGRYANASDYIRDLIRRDQDRGPQVDPVKLAAMQALVDEGLASGAAEPFELDQFLTEVRADGNVAAE